MITITAETPIWTVEQARAYNAAHPERTWCGCAHPNFPHRFEGEGFASKAYCMVCGQRHLGAAAERDFRPNGYIAADLAHFSRPDVIAKLAATEARHTTAAAAKRIKLGLIGRRAILRGATYSRTW